MNRPTRSITPRKLARWAMSAMFMVLTFVAVWPASLGGKSSLVVVRGKSMEPTYHLGDLLYARTEDHYGVGDVVVYRVPEGQPGAGVLVVHRLTGINDDGTLVIQGDNKDAPDDLKLTTADLVATPVWNLGSAPTRLLTVVPFLLAALIGMIVTYMLWPADTDEVELDDEEPAEKPEPVELIPFAIFGSGDENSSRSDHADRDTHLPENFLDDLDLSRFNTQKTPVEWESDLHDTDSVV